MHIDATHTYERSSKQQFDTKRLTRRVITVSITIVATKILAATLKTAQQNDRESDSSKITHMHMDAIHTYERSSRQQFDTKRLTRHFITVSITMAASKILAATLKTAQQMTVRAIRVK